MRELAEKVAVVTGAASGIGAGLARAFAAEGMHVVLADVEPAGALAAELAASGVRAEAVYADVSRESDVRALADHAYDAFGAVHLLCNNAGVCQGGPIHEMTASDWEWILSVNLYGVIHGCRVFVPRMIEGGAPAHIVNTASVGGFLSGGGLGMYTTSKFAIVAYSEALAQDVAAHGIGVSVLCPGATSTRLLDAARNRPEALGSAPARMDAIADALPSGMDPLEVGRHAVRGVREDALYVFTDAAFEPVIASRFETVLAAIRRAAGAP